LFKRTKCTYYETEGKTLGTKNEEKLEFPGDDNFFLLILPLKGTFTRKSGNNNITGSLKMGYRHYGKYLVYLKLKALYSK
jgi:hypothetical protein